MLETERRHLIERLWVEQPKLFVHGEGTLCTDHTGRNGQEEAWPLGRDVLEWIAGILPAQASTLETGCGYSTIVFAICGARHTAIAPDYQQHGRIVRWCEDHGVSCADLRLIDARSQDVLPGMLLEPLDLVLIDGCHAFPAPALDWYYTAEKIKPGGYLVVDDCQLVTGKQLVDFLEQETGRWKLQVRFGKTAVFRKIATGPVVEGFEWIDQPYCRNPAPAPAQPGLFRKWASCWRRLWSSAP